MDIQGYWARVRTLERSLPPPPEEIFITSIEDHNTGLKGGVVTSCDRLTAAKYITKGSHRLATDKEVDELRKKEAAHQSELHERLIASKQQFMTITNPEQLQMLALRPPPGKPKAEDSK